MGNASNSFSYERWGKRTPDGPLITFDPLNANNGSLCYLIENFDYEATDTILNVNNTDNPNIAINNNMIKTNINTVNNINKNDITMKTVRNSRRRPTYSPAARKIEIESDDDEDKASTDNSEEGISANDIKAEKIKQYRKTLTKVVKIKTAIFHETVKVTCSKDGKMLEWYKGKSDASGKKKPIGHFPLNKITSIRTKPDNPKSLEIAVSSGNISTYLFSFKTREEREDWQNNLESFKKIMSMK